MKRDKLILFGAGRNGTLALKKYGRGKVAFFCDNLPEKQGTEVEEILVVSFEEMLRYYYEGYNIMITPEDNTYLISVCFLSL